MSSTPSKLTPAAIRAGLKALPSWEFDPDEHAIHRKFVFDDFDAAMLFINKVADIAREMDHHPELHNVYSEVALLMTTHDAGGVTERDLRFARAVDALVDSDEEELDEEEADERDDN